MKITAIFILTLTCFGQSVAPKVSDASRAAYTKALQDVNNAQANSIQLSAQIAKAQAESAKALQDANEAAQKALAAAQADCGKDMQLDGKALQEKGELSCIAKGPSK